MHDTRKTISLIAAFVLAGLVINHAFLLLTPQPDSPEIDRAKAQIMLMEAEAKIDSQHIYQVYGVALFVILIGLALCFGSFFLALRVVNAIQSKQVYIGDTSTIPQKLVMYDHRKS